MCCNYLFTLFTLLILSWPVNATVRVVDDLGRSVELAAPAQRIISLAPHLTEILASIGAAPLMVGIDSSSDYPAYVKRLPKVGNYLTINAEAILRLHPDLILVWQASENRQQLEELEKLGLPIYVSSPQKLVSVIKTINDLTILTRIHPQAAGVLEEFKTSLLTLQQDYSTQKKLRVFYEIWHSPLMTVNQDSLINEVIILCGGKNSFATAKPLTPIVDIESVLAKNPEVIVGDDVMSGWRNTWATWPWVSAVQHHAIFSIDANLLQRFTPRLLVGAKALCEDLAMVRHSKLPPVL